MHKYFIPVTIRMKWPSCVPIILHNIKVSCLTERRHPLTKGLSFVVLWFNLYDPFHISFMLYSKAEWILYQVLSVALIKCPDKSSWWERFGLQFKGIQSIVAGKVGQQEQSLPGDQEAEWSFHPHLGNWEGNNRKWYWLLKLKASPQWHTSSIEAPLS